jgi:two-component system alkaline phosphatase synthesis response regulator PhoP
MSRARILVVEDDPAIITALTEKLRLEGHEVEEARDGEDARRRLGDEAFDLLVLDLMLPKIDGLTLLRWLRKKTRSLPVLIVSAKGREAEKVEGLRAGADDYLAKPFGVAELLARVEALLRRSRGPAKSFAFGDAILDLERKAITRKGREVPLSPKEMEVLAYLARNAERTVPRDEILTAVWGCFASSGARTVDFHILNLRRKLEPDPDSPKHIVTRHGWGYQLVP